MQVRTLEQSFLESSQHLQQLQVHVLHIEEQAATYKLQTTEHIQRLQALHAEALSMKQQQVAAAATTAHLFVNDFLVAVGYVDRGERGAAGRCGTLCEGRERCCRERGGEGARVQAGGVLVL